MTDQNKTYFLPHWPNAHVPNSADSTRTVSIYEEVLDVVPLSELQQGEVYIVKIKLIALALFQGWDDDMCCFSVLRTDIQEEVRWSEARYLPNNFDAYHAFDYAGNPPIHVWAKQLRAAIPVNWFNIFEEARHMQRQWGVSYWDTEPVMIGDASIVGIEDAPQQHYTLTDKNPVQSTEQDLNNNTSSSNIGSTNDESTEEEQEHESNTTKNQLSDEENTAPHSTMGGNSLLLSKPPTPASRSPPSKSTPTPAMRLQNQYTRSTTEVVQKQEDRTMEASTSKPKQDTVNQSSTSASTTTTGIVRSPKPEIKQRRSFSSFFLKKKKSKKSLVEQDDTVSKKRKNTLPATTMPPNTNVIGNKPSVIEIPTRKAAGSTTKDSTETTIPDKTLHSTTNNLDTTTSPISLDDLDSSASSSPAIKTPRNKSDNESSNTNKIELFDMESYFDMQATFAFLNNTNTDAFSLLSTPGATKATV